MSSPANLDLQIRKWNASAAQWEDVIVASSALATLGFSAGGVLEARTPANQRIASGALLHTRTAKSANFTITSSDYGVFFDVTTGTSTITATLPAASDVPGFLVGLRKADLSGGHIITSPATRRMRFVDQIMVLYSDGTNWLIKETALWPWQINPGKYAGVFDDAEAATPFIVNGTGNPSFTLLGSSTELGIASWPTVASSGSSLTLRANQSAGVWSGAAAALYFEARHKIDGAVDATNDMLIWLGMHDGQSGAPADGVGYFMLDRTKASPGNWYYCTANNSTRTEIDTGIAYDTNFHLFRIFNAAGVTYFWIDDTYIGSINTNLPTTSTRNCSPWHIRRNFVAGSPTTMQTDWGILYAALATMR